MKRRKILRPVWGLCLTAVFLADALLGFSAARADEPSGTGGTEWNLAMIGADTASSLGFRGQNVRIGVIDSGVSPHPAFADRLVGGHNYVADAPDPEDTSDAYGHGTRVAGLIAAVAPEAEIVPLKITDSGSVSTSL
ncbi:MAG: S8 family serine peptidase, partial [Clostridia bacterium]|nr:S8 family serine peptidase [Clostridia bacterium]